MNFEKIELKGTTWYIADLSKVEIPEEETKANVFSKELLKKEIGKNLPEYLKRLCHCITIGFQEKVYSGERGYYLVNKDYLSNIKEEEGEKILIFFEITKISGLLKKKLFVKQLKDKNGELIIGKFIGGLTMNRFMRECRLEDPEYFLTKQMLNLDLKKIELKTEVERFGEIEHIYLLKDKEKFINKARMPLNPVLEAEGFAFEKKKERCLLRWNLLLDIRLEERRLKKNLTTIEKMDEFIEMRFIKLLYGKLIFDIEKNPIDLVRNQSRKKRKTENNYVVEERLDYMVSNTYSKHDMKLFLDDPLFSSDRETRGLLTFAILLYGSEYMIQTFLGAEKDLIKFKIRRYYKTQNLILECIEEIDKETLSKKFDLVECDPEKDKSLLEEALGFFKVNHPTSEEPKKWFKTYFLNVLEFLSDWNLFIQDGYVYLNYVDLIDFYITEKIFKKSAELYFNEKARNTFILNCQKIKNNRGSRDPRSDAFSESERFKKLFATSKEIVEICSEFEKTKNLSMDQNVKNNLIDIEDLVSKNHLHRVPLCVVNQFNKINSSGIMELKNKERFQITGYLMNLDYTMNDIILFLRQKDTTIGTEFDKRMKVIEESYLKTRKTSEDRIFVQNGCAKSSDPDNIPEYMSSICPFARKSEPDFTSHLSVLLNSVGISNIQNQYEIIEKAKESKFTHIPCQMTFKYAHRIFKEEKYDPFADGKPITYPFQYTKKSIQSETEREKKKGLISFFV